MFASRTTVHCCLCVMGLAAFTSQGIADQARDAAASMAIGTSVISGVVMDMQDPPRPLRRAIVTVSGAEIGTPRSAIADDQGRFAIRHLPAGQVTVVAAKAGYVDSTYGARRTGQPGTPIDLRADQVVDIAIRVGRAAAFTGFVRSDKGEPLPGMRVFAIDGASPVPPSPLPAAARGGSREGSTALTDERGMYRLFNLVPGEYIIAVTPVASIEGEVIRRTTQETDALLTQLAGRSSSRRPLPAAGVSELRPGAFGPAYYPGTPALRDAIRVKVGTGDVREGLNIVWIAVPVTTIEGTVIGPGALPASVELSINPGESIQFFALGGANPQLARPPGPDGQFKYGGIVPGRYSITARASGAAARTAFTGREGGTGALPADSGSVGSAEALYAFEEFEVIGQPVKGLTLRLQPGSRVSGRIGFDTEKQPVPAPTQLRVSIRSSAGTRNSSVNGTLIGNTFGQPSNVTPAPDGSFEFSSLPPGRYTLHVVVPAAAGSWWFRSAIRDSRDYLDDAMVLAPGENLADLVLTLTDRRSEISGTLQTATGRPAADHAVVVMSADTLQWKAGSRRVKTSRPSTDGKFTVTDLPAGDYLLVALTDVEPADLQKPDFLASIAPAGVKITLGQGERKRQDLRIGK